jgi:hypothetical protein
MSDYLKIVRADRIEMARKDLARAENIDFGDSIQVADNLGRLKAHVGLLLELLDDEMAERDDDSRVEDGRCAAAHSADPDPCIGPVVVMVTDQEKNGAHACEHHGARILASLDHGSVYGLPGAPMGTAVRVFKAAREIEPFCWLR